MSIEPWPDRYIAAEAERHVQEHAERTIRAHQYLYYVKSTPVWSDYDYDMFCRSHGVEGGGGSDRASDYTTEEKTLAERILAEPEAHPAIYDREKAMNYKPKEE